MDNQEELRPVLFANLGAQMGYYGLTDHSMAARAGLNYHRVRDMRAGRTYWKDIYMSAIQKTCFPERTIDWLFTRFE